MQSKLLEKAKGQSLIDQGIGIMVIMIVVGAVALPVIQSSLVLDLETVNNETQASSGSVPDVFTVNNVEDGLEPNSDTLWFNDSFQNTVQPVPSENYTVDYPNGEFNVTEADFDGDGITEINATSDEYLVSYDYRPNGYITSSTSRLILGYLPLILAMALFIVAISIIRG